MGILLSDSAWRLVEGPLETVPTPLGAPLPVKSQTAPAKGVAAI